VLEAAGTRTDLPLIARSCRWAVAPPLATHVGGVFHFADVRRQEPVRVWSNRSALHHPRDPTVRIAAAFVVFKVEEAYPATP
jgi:hypothetical protein